MDLESRVRQLERSNKILRVWAAAGIVTPLVALVGFQEAQTPDLIIAKRIQVVDSRGVPLVTLGASRAGGGNVELRDANGDRRAWISLEKNSGRIGLISGDADQPSASLGLSVEPNQARIAVTGERSTATVSVAGERPEIAASGSNGQVLFSAPWRRQ